MNTNLDQWSHARREFGDWTPPEGATIPEGFTDSSWHNDICPSLTGGNVRVWVDYENPAEREMGGARYSVHLYDNSGGFLHEEYEGDDWAPTCQAAIAAKLAAELRNKYPEHTFETEKARAYDGDSDARIVEFVDEKSGICVVDPFGSTCARFHVDPRGQYGIEPKDAHRIAAHNFPHGVVHNWTPDDAPDPTVEADCAAGFHSWIAQRGKLHPDTRCEHCGELYGDPK